MLANETSIETSIENGALVVRTIIGGSARVVGRFQWRAGKWRKQARPNRVVRALAWLFADPMAY